MLPLARAEIEGVTPTFLESLFEGKLKGQGNAIVGDNLVQLVLLGGFPEAISRDNERRRQDWARSYLRSILTRDLLDIAEVEKLTELPKFVRLLAEHSGQLVNYSQFGAGINVSHKTGQRYVGLLEQVFLIATVQPWFTNALKRMVKTPKLHFLDSGLLATVRGLTFNRVKSDRGTFGALLESFVLSEVLKLMTASNLRLRPYHFRDRDMREVDIVLERDDGTIVGIEVKASATTVPMSCRSASGSAIVLFVELSGRTSARVELRDDLGIREYFVASGDRRGAVGRVDSGHRAGVTAIGVEMDKGNAACTPSAMR